MKTLQDRCVKLEEQCKARYEAGERSEAFNQFMDKFNNVNTILDKIANLMHCVIVSCSEIQLKTIVI